MSRVQLVFVFCLFVYFLLSLLLLSHIHRHGTPRTSGGKAVFTGSIDGPIGIHERIRKRREYFLAHGNISQEVSHNKAFDSYELKQDNVIHVNRLSQPVFDFCMNDVGYKSRLKTQRFSKQIYLYSAFYDDREEKHFIRIISAVKLTKFRKRLWCHFDKLSNSDDDTDYVTDVSYYEMCENHSRKFGGWMLSCEVPEAYMIQGRLPCDVTVTTTSSPADESARRVKMSILTTRSREAQIDFVVCVPPLFGKVRSEDLVQFVELMRVLGASYFVFYVYDAHPQVKSVLSYYQTIGLASVFRWVTPSDNMYHIWNHGQLIAANDCMYRHMSTAEFVIFHDVDEFLVPHAQEITSLRGIVTEMYDKEITCGMSFKSAFFDIAFRANNDYKIGNLSVLDISSRSKFFSELRNKVIVKPEKVFEVGIHHVSRCWPDGVGYEVGDVPIDVAFIHHYRPCVETWDMNCIDGVQDTLLVDRFGGEFYRRYLETTRRMLLRKRNQKVKNKDLK